MQRFRHPIDLRAANGVHDRQQVVALERQLEGQELDHDAAEREQVGAGIERVPHHLLGRHVDRGALGDVGGGRLVEIRIRLRDAEVEDLDIPSPAHDHVGRLQIAMHQVERSALAVLKGVRVPQAPADVRQNLDDHGARKLEASATCLLQESVKGPSVHVLHGHVVVVSDLIELVDLNDVLVTQLAAQTGLVDEAADHALVGRQPWIEALQGHILLEPHRPGKNSSVHLGHAPFA